MVIDYKEMSKIIGYYNSTYIQPKEELKRKVTVGLELNPKGVEVKEMGNRKYGLMISDAFNSNAKSLRESVKTLPKSIEWKISEEVLNIPVNTTLKKAPKPRDKSFGTI